MTRAVAFSALLLAVCGLPLQDLRAQNDTAGNPTGNSGDFNGEVTTAGSYDPFTGNAKRAVTDLTVPGANGAYPLSFVRISNSRMTSVNGDTQRFGDCANWRHSYQWAVSQELNDNNDMVYRVAYPDGQVVNYRNNRQTKPSSETWWRGPAGTTDRLEVVNANYIQLHLSDGGRVQFSNDNGIHNAGPYWRADALVDPYGAITTLTYDLGSFFTLIKVTEPCGRYLTFGYTTYAYGTGRWKVITSVTASTATASNNQSVTYLYTIVGPTGQPNPDPNGTLFLALGGAVYNAEPQSGMAGNPPIRSYYTDQFYSNYAPLLSTCIDPHYAGAMTQIRYAYNTNLAYWGIVAAEQNLTTSESVSTLAQNYPGVPTYATEVRGDNKLDGSGNLHAFWYFQSAVGPEQTNARSYQLTTTTDYQGAASYTLYYGDGDKDTHGSGYVRKTFDRQGYPTIFDTEPYIGKVRGVTLPDGRVRTSIWGGSSASDATNPYYLYQTTDERGQSTHLSTNYTRNSSHLVSRIDYPDGSNEQFTYQFVGGALYKLKTHTNKLGAVFTYNYDEVNFNHGGSGHPGLLTSISRAYATVTGTAVETTQFFYDALDRLIKSTDARGVGDIYTYNGRHQVIQVQHIAGNNTRKAWYDDFGNCVKTEDELLHPTTMVYDEYRRLTSVTVPVDYANNFTRTTTYTYERRSVSNAQIATDTSHTARGYSQVIYPSGKGERNVYDDNGAVYQQWSGMVWNGSALQGGNGYSFKSCDRDPNGRVTVQRDAHGYPWQASYDGSGRVTSTTDPNGHVSSYTYYGPVSPLAGLPKTATVPGNGSGDLTTSYSDYDEMGRLLTSQIPDSTSPASQVGPHTFTSAYDLGGNLKSQTDGETAHPKTKYESDMLGRKSKTTHSDNTYEQWGYDGSGNVVTYRNRKGNTQTSTYDLRNRLTGYTWDDGITIGANMSYDAASRMNYISNGYASRTMTYDDSGALKTDQQYVDGGGNVPALTYTYDADGRPAKVTYPGQDSVSWVYNDRGQITANRGTTPNLPGYTATLASYTYNGDWLSSRTLQNNSRTEYQYQPNGRITQVKDTYLGSSPARNISTRHYGYYPNGQMYWFNKDANPADTSLSTSALENGAGDAYYYNPDGSFYYNYQEAQGAYSSSVDAHGDSASITPSSLKYLVCYLDKAGNRTQSNNSGAVVNYTPDTNNRYPGITYDAAGNSTVANGVTCTYDASGNLTQANVPGHFAIFRYDTQGRCCVRNVDGAVTFFYYIGDRVAEERDGNGNRAVSYVYGPGGQTVARVDANWTGIYYHYDARGYVTHLTDPSCNLIEQYLYDAFGTPLVYDGTGTVSRGQFSAYGNRQMFCGSGGYEWYPEVGIYHAGARDYLPALGRWLQPDPIGQEGGLNVYAYCGNDPINLTDPSGLYFGEGLVALLSQGADAVSQFYREHVPTWLGGVQSGQVYIGTGGQEGESSSQSNRTLPPSVDGDEDPIMTRWRMSGGAAGSPAWGRPGTGAELKDGGMASLSAAANMAMLPLGGGGAAVERGIAKGAAELVESEAIAVAEGAVAKFEAKSGQKIAQQIARWRDAGGQGGLKEFLKHAEDFASRAEAAGTHVTGTVGQLTNATIYREGSTYMVVQGGKIMSYVPNASPGGIVDVYVGLGGL